MQNGILTIGVCLFPTGLVPVATRDAIIPVLDLDGSQGKANHVLATAGPVLDLPNPSLVHAHANPIPVQLTASPAQRANQR